MSPEVERFLSSLSQKACEGHDIVILPSSPQYKENTKVWGMQRYLKPEVVVKPTKISQIPDITQLLFESSLDFAVRNGGVGSTSARHVLVSLGALNNVSFDCKTETVLVDAGANWEDVDSYMAKAAPGWVVVGSRTPFVGVAGLVLIGGISWLSHEYGLVSDPQNLLDVQIALGDGRLIWASEEKDLLWAIRGGRCAFGVITSLKFRARQIDTDNIYLSQITYPMSKLDEIQKGLAKHLSTNRDPYLAMHAFLLDSGSHLFDHEPGVGIMLFDRHGSEHAHSVDGYKWAFDIEDGQEAGGLMNLYEVNKLTDFAKVKMDNLCLYDATGLIDEVDESFLSRGKAWYDKVVATDPVFAKGSYFLVEACKPAVFLSAPATETAWPRDRAKHVLQLGVGYPPENSHLKPLALELLAEAFQTIPLTALGKAGFTPTFFEPSFMDLEGMYGENYSKLKDIADKYDPERKFRSIFKLQPDI